MKAFTYDKAATPEGSAAAVARVRGAKFIAGECKLSPLPVEGGVI